MNIYRSHYCSILNISNLNQEVTLSGWVDTIRDHGNLIFIDLRDKSGVLQVVFNPEVSSDAHDLASNLRSEWVVQIKGIIVKRISGAENDSISTGSVELQASELKILNK